MSLVFNTPKSALNTTSKAIQNLKSGDCPEPSLTTESVEYTENGEYSVATPEGFDGLSAVSVTVNIDTEAIADAAYAEGEAAGQRQGYQAGYEAGETSGIAEGIAEQKAKLTSLNVTSNGTYNKEDGYNSVTVDVPSSEPNLETGVVEDAHLYGEYSPSEGYDGFATISVSVSPSAKGTASNPFTSRDDITDEIDTAGGLVMGSYYSVTLTEDDTIEYDPDETGDKMYAVTKASTDPDYPDNSFSIFERDGDYYKEWPTGFSLKAGDVLLLCGTELTEGGTCMIYAYNGNLDETTWASSGSSCPDWSTIGWDCNDVNNSSLADDLAYAAQKKEAFESGTISSFANTNLIFIPRVVLPANSSFLFSNCTAAKNVPLSFEGQPTNINQMFNKVPLNHQPSFDWSEVTNAAGAFNRMTYGQGIPYNPVVNAPKCTTMQSCFASGQSSNGTMTTATVNAPLVTNSNSMFANNKNLATVNLTLGKVTDISLMFSGCSSLSAIPSIDTSNCKNFSDVLLNCSSITTFPSWDFTGFGVGDNGLSSSTLNSGPFAGTGITSIPNITIGNGTVSNTNKNVSFGGMTNLTTVGNITFNIGIGAVTFRGDTNLTTIGGLTNFGGTFGGDEWNDSNADILLQDCTALTKQSIMNVINTVGDRPSANVAGTIQLSATSYALLDASDIAIATAKNWSVTSA